MSTTTETIHALLVDDDHIGAELTVSILRGVDPTLELVVAGDGEHALAILRRASEAPATTPMPRVVFLDLNMPRLDGHEVLREIRADPALTGIRVVMFTNSDRPSDVAESMRLGADAHVAKPVSVEELIQRLRGIAHLWQTSAPRS